MAPSSSLQIPNMDGARPGSGQGSRPVSANIQAGPSPPQPPSKKQRASHQVGGTTQNQQDSPTVPYTDVYSHPAAIAYAAAHPRRQIPKFGPYLLLQTLGEGEFGKVKLGLHCQWGEEVAVKLIRRGSVDNSVRMSKVEREIEVLRTLKHPNIVRLYDVIETDKYIGIVIEYASGGELFDHILAHRYLKERDAAKLFSQLISGVWYIHQKKIVHRDLKLENLLLDRHRNVIITDFGFANKFEHRADELMQTSCGSPCYAAPELVISEGLYVGSAVDIWSCGVILYAMLAGYLPFDDDPANPDGDNINLLYKYIVNTPLSFPEYVSESARDLLKMMLVPDPSRRASLLSVMRHPWLAAYSSPPTEPNSDKPTAFGRTVEELERIAMEQHQAKRRAYQMQMKAAMAQSAQTANAIAPSVSSPVVGGRSTHHSHKTDSGYAPSAGVASPRTRSIQQQDYLYETPIDQSVSSPAGFGGSAPAIVPTTTQDAAGYEMVVDDPFAPPPGIASPAAVDESTPSKKKHHHQSSGQRHTIQLEYDESRGPGREKKRERSEAEHGSGKRTRSRSGSRSRHQQQQQQSPPTSPPVPVAVNGSPERSKKRRPSQASESSIHKPLPPSPPVHKSSSSPTTSRINTMGAAVPPVTTTETVHAPSITLGTPPDTPITFAKSEAALAASDSTDRVQHKDSKDGSASQSSSTRHKRGPSAALGGLAKIFGAASGGGEGDTTPSINTSGSLAEKKDEEAMSPSGKKSRRATLTVVVDSIKSRTGKGKNTATTPLPHETMSAVYPSAPKSAVLPPTTAPSAFDTEPPPSATRSTLGASTNKARGVMQWFRAKSKGRDSVGTPTGSAEPPTPLMVNGSATYRRKNAASSSTVNATSPSSTISPSNTAMSPVQIVNVPPRTPSESHTITPSFITKVRNSVTIGGGGGLSSSSKEPKGPKGSGAMRIHHGAVDQNMVSTRPPGEAFSHVREILVGMGLEIQIEGEFKYRCVRVKRPKPMGSRSGLMGSVPGTNVAAFQMAGSAASNGVDKRGLPVPSSHASFSGGGMLRGLLMRRQSSHISTGAASASFEEETSDSSFVVGGLGDPVYGDLAEDAGDEVRFSVELTRIDRLTDTYSLDIRRLKGNLRSYKFLYDTIRDRAALA